MNNLARIVCPIFLVVVFSIAALATLSTTQDPKPQDDRGLRLAPSPVATPTPERPNSQSSQPEIVLQAGISAPQSQIGFSPDGRLLASMGINGNTIKLWEVGTGLLLRQLESSIPSMGTSSMTRPFRFGADGKTLIAVDDKRVRRWEVETGRELKGTVLPDAKGSGFVLLSDDGSTIAALNLSSSVVRLWDTAAGRELRSMPLEEEEQIASQDAIALSPNGKLLAAVTETDKVSMKGIERRLQVCLWDVASGRKTSTLKVQQRQTQLGASNDEIASLAFSPDGGWLALRNEVSMKIWDVANGREVKSFASPKVSSGVDPFLIFAARFIFSPDRRLISAVSDGRKIELLDAVSGATVNTLAAHERPVLGLGFSADGKLVASSSADNQIKLWDVSTGAEVRTLSGAAMPISDVAFSPDGKSLVIAGPGAASFWELTTGGVRKTLALPSDYAQVKQVGMTERSSMLSRDGRTLIAGSDKEPVAKLWQVASGKELSSVSLTQGKQLGNAAFSADGRTLALTERDVPKPGNRPGSSVSAQNPNVASPDVLPMPDMSKIMEQMRKDPKKAQEQMQKVQEAMSKGDLSAGINMMESMGMMPASNRSDRKANTLRILDITSGRQLQAIPLSGFLDSLAENSIMSSAALSFSPDGRVLASAYGFGGPIVLRDVGSGKELRTLRQAGSLSINALAWSPDGKLLASAHWGTRLIPGDPNVVRDFSFEDLTFAINVWDVQTGSEIKSLSGHGNFVERLAFSRDGRLLASGSYDSTVKLWDPLSGSELRTLKGHTGAITTLDFTPDANFIVSGSDDGSALLWNTQTGELLATLVSLNQGDDWLVGTPDGLFDGSPGGWNQILWRFTPSISDVSPVEIFFNEYFHPGLLPDLLTGKKLRAQVDISRKDRRQPKLKLERAGTQDANVETRTISLKVNVTEAPAGAQDVRLFRNGSLVKSWRGDVLQGQASAALETSVSVVAGPNRFSAYAFNLDNVKSTDATLSLNGDDSLKRPATLHLLVIGVDEYANSAYNLKYATADARAFAEEVERQQRRLGRYQQIELISLLNREATKANLLSALNRLAGVTGAGALEGSLPGLEKIKTAEPEDAVVVYFAGHGTAQRQRFYLIPHDLGYEGKRTELDAAGMAAILSHSVSDLELEQLFERIDAGMMLMVIDACNSGQALEAEEKRRGPMNSKGLAQLAYEKGIYILTAAQSYQAALEAEQLGHGYLTFALVEEGLKTALADGQPEDGKVTLREWFDYAAERVPRMQEAKMREKRGLGLELAFVEGEEKVVEVEKRNLQRPRVFYRRELEAQPFIVARP